ncbi:MAG: hypothetical protein RR322_01825 [Oscillospiraceae bacterium]
MKNISVEEINATLCKLAKDDSFSKMDIENALYDLKAVAENEYNFDYWRTFYDILQKITIQIN